MESIYSFMQSIFLSHFLKFLHYPFYNEKEKLGNMKMEQKKKGKLKGLLML